MKILNFLTKKHAPDERMKELLLAVHCYCQTHRGPGLCIICQDMHIKRIFTDEEYRDVVSYIYEHRPKSAKDVHLPTSKHSICCDAYFWKPWHMSVRMRFLKRLIRHL